MILIQFGNKAHGQWLKVLIYNWIRIFKALFHRYALECCSLIFVFVFILVNSALVLLLLNPLYDLQSWLFYQCMIGS
eukprot:CAMPEP_0202017630 /NCGR_PEP_ID=MMETSP0905-20130828/37527_1 /ASSEMBLY_ACC=CAM_ASM_000554 /TAXON_ID=420261 /ORGANISM="Thalassiosira antarctica, Strain CCMP982" /LENGTH=76 /DNA_ID=CAMNT_0048578343 /DNA_START=31 /DNA_END=258 /DNA_ORIENTATION=+